MKTTGRKSPNDAGEFCRELAYSAGISHISRNLFLWFRFQGFLEWCLRRRLAESKPAFFWILRMKIFQCANLAVWGNGGWKIIQRYPRLFHRNPRRKHRYTRQYHVFLPTTEPCYSKDFSYFPKITDKKIRQIKCSDHVNTHVYSDAVPVRLAEQK